MEQLTPFEAASRELFGAIRNSAAERRDLEAEKALFVEHIESLSRLYPNPVQRERVALVGGVAAWDLFGEYDDPLPPGLVKMIGKDDSVYVDVDKRLISIEDFRLLYSLIFRDLSLEGQLFFSGTYDLSEKHSQVVGPLYAETFRRTEAYRLLQSFDMPPPDVASSAQLTPWWRMVREAQIAADIRRRFGMDQQEHIARGSMAEQVLRRLIAQLDDEEMPLKVQAETAQRRDPFERARKFFRPIIMRELRAPMGSAIVDIKFRAESVLGYTKHGADEDDYNAYQDRYNLFRQYVKERRNTQYNLDGAYENEFLSTSVHSLFGKTPDSYQHWLEQAVGNNAEETLGYMCDGIDGELHKSELWAFMRHAQGPVLPSDAFANILEKDYLVKECVTFTPAETQEGLRRQHIGMVQMRPPDEYAKRLIQGRPRERQSRTAEPTYQLRLWQEFDDQDPFIPGLQLVMHLGDVYGFVADPEGDPYVRADIPIPPEGREALAAAYQELGLFRLVDDIRRISMLTVEDVRYCIQKRTTYVYKIMMPNIQGLSDFERHVKKGCLELQCSGSAHFLQHSLNLAFDRLCAGVISGYSMSPHTDGITALGHVQTTFTYDGRTYILDATGFSEGERPSPPKAGSAPRIGRVAIKPPKVLEVPPPSREERLMAIQNSLEEKLQIIFDAANRDQLNKQLIKRSKDDPIRRVIKLLWRLHDSGRVDELEDAQHYLANIKTADPQLLHELGLAGYVGREDILELLAHSLQSAAAVQ